MLNEIRFIYLSWKIGKALFKLRDAGHYNIVTSPGTITYITDDNRFYFYISEQGIEHTKILMDLRDHEITTRMRYITWNNDDIYVLMEFHKCDTKSPAWKIAMKRLEEIVNISKEVKPSNNKKLKD